MYCSTCGAPADPQARHCTRCGADLGRAGAIRLTRPSEGSGHPDAGAQPQGTTEPLDATQRFPGPGASAPHAATQGRAPDVQPHAGQDQDAALPIDPSIFADAPRPDAPTRTGTTGSFTSTGMAEPGPTTDLLGPEQGLQPRTRRRGVSRTTRVVAVVVLLVAVTALVALTIFFLNLGRSQQPTDQGTQIIGSSTSAPGSSEPSASGQPSSSGTDASSQPASSAATSSAATSSTSASSAAASASWPANAKQCSGSVAVNPSTSCEFAAAVAKAAANGTDAFSVEATSPVTHKKYMMQCTTQNKLVTCTGGDNAVVYLAR